MKTRLATIALLFAALPAYAADVPKPEYKVHPLHAAAKPPAKAEAKTAHKKSKKAPCGKGSAIIAAYEKSMQTMHENMNIAYTGDADVDFVTGMIPHHQGAVDMARVVIQYGKDPVIRKLAHAIIIGQESEIGFMKTWLRGHKSNYVAPDAASQSSVIAYKQVMGTMHEGMMTNYTGDADLDFVRGMIPHHQGAVDMAYILMRDGKSLALRELARDITRSQQQEIALMKEWLATHNSIETPQPKADKKHEHHAHH